MNITLHNVPLFCCLTVMVFISFIIVQILEKLYLFIKRKKHIFNYKANIASKHMVLTIKLLMKEYI